MHQRIKYDVLSQKELEYMKGRLEQILIERGVHLDHEEMLKALEEKGCIVDMEARDRALHEGAHRPRPSPPSPPSSRSTPPTESTT